MHVYARRKRMKVTGWRVIQLYELPLFKAAGLLLVSPDRRKCWTLNRVASERERVNVVGVN